MTTPITHRESHTPAARFGRVVVGVGHDGADAALALARALAPQDAAFILVHVHRAPTVTGNVPLVPAAGGDDVEHSLALLRKARASLGIPCEIAVEASTSVAHGLHAVAVREQADLIVVAAHTGAESWSTGLPGVLHHAPCAVAISSPQAGGGRLHLERVAVAYRPTSAGRAAAAAAASVADAAGAKLDAITVVPVQASPWIGPAGGAIHELARLDGTLVDYARTDLEQLAPATAHVREGDPVDVLGEFSRSVDLLVIGARSAGPLGRMLCGDTTDPLAAATASALLVVPSEPSPTRKTT